MRLVLRLVEFLPEHFKTDHLANILAGVNNSMISSFKHNQLDFFGKGSAHSDKFWCTVIHQGLTLHLLGKEIETYGLIYVTDAGREFLKHPYELQLVEDRQFSKSAAEDDEDEENVAATAAVLSGGGGDSTLLSMLKDLRKSQAHKLGLQPWIIFGDPSLEDMTILYPVSFEDLQKCQGVGEGKARKFGAPFIALIKRYVEENDITRPDDFVVKSAPTKSENKIFIIKSVDRRMSFEDIASARDLEYDELISEMESIVATGTKLNIDYEIRDKLDEEVVEEIYDYFKNEAASDSVEEAIEALGADYDEMEIRLVRIKFLCEIAS